MDLYEWARKWNISELAIAELTQAAQHLDSTNSGRTETDILNMVRMEASTRGARLWRNNLGAAYMQDGSFLRYGLANDSKNLNDVLKSSDLIGIKPVVITQAHVGKTLGVFIAREIKRKEWKFSNSPREKAQLNFITLINSLGGDACFTNSTGSIK
jgi:hypothetical protein